MTELTVKIAYAGAEDAERDNENDTVAESLMAPRRGPNEVAGVASCLSLDRNCYAFFFLLLVFLAVFLAAVFFVFLAAVFVFVFRCLMP